MLEKLKVACQSEIMRFRRFIKPAILLSVAFGLGCWIFYPLIGHAKYNAQRSSCLSNLKQIALACAYYTRDYDGVLPPISQGQAGWAELIEPEEKMWPAFRCPSGAQAAATFSSDYFFNARIAGEKRSRISVGSLTIAFGDGMDNGATNSHLSELPLDWKSDEKSPAQRHLSGANYGFVDGHVKWLKPEKVSVETPKIGAFTFAIK